MSDNRKRKKQIIIRLTDEEHELLLQRMHSTGMINMSAYIRKMALTGYILRMDFYEVRETLRLVANATSNINQIARVANETRSMYASDMIQLREEVGKLRSQASKAIKVFMKVQMFLDL